jgi:hypothetical protein
MRCRGSFPRGRGATADSYTSAISKYGHVDDGSFQCNEETKAASLSNSLGRHLLSVCAHLTVHAGLAIPAADSRCRQRPRALPGKLGVRLGVTLPKLLCTGKCINVGQFPRTQQSATPPGTYQPRRRQTRSSCASVWRRGLVCQPRTVMPPGCSSPPQSLHFGTWLVSRCIQDRLGPADTKATRVQMSEHSLPYLAGQ